MGSWGPGVFENDTALDFVLEIERSMTIQPLTDALEAVTRDLTGPFRCLTNATAERLLVASEVCLAARGKPSKLLRPELADWLRRVQPDIDDAMIRRIIPAVTHVLDDSEASEIREGDAIWTAIVERIIGRLNEVVSQPPKAC